MNPDPVVLALNRLATAPRIQQEFDRAHTACSRLRFHEGLRRRWPQARAEAAIRCAQAGASLTGARLDLQELRAAIVAGSEQQAGMVGDPMLQTGLAQWRAQAHILGLFPPLQRGPGNTPPAVEPWPQLLAGLHRDLQLPFADPRMAEDTKGETQLETVLALLTATTAPGAVRAGIVRAELAHSGAFGSYSASIGRVLARLLLVLDGTDPTGVALTDALAAEQPKLEEEALAAYREGTPAGVEFWLRYWARAIAAGAKEGETVAVAVLAGRLSAD